MAHWIFAPMLSLILLGGVGWEPVSDRLQSLLAPLGFDFALQPFTYDMAIMYDPNSRTGLHRQEVYEFVFKTRDGEKVLSWGKTRFYSHRVLAMALIESHAEGVLEPWLVNGAICHQLRREFGEGDRFMLRTNPSLPILQDLGLNRFHPCDPGRSRSPDQT